MGLKQSIMFAMMSTINAILVIVCKIKIVFYPVDYSWQDHTFKIHEDGFSYRVIIDETRAIADGYWRTPYMIVIDGYRAKERLIIVNKKMYYAGLNLFHPLFEQKRAHVAIGLDLKFSTMLVNEAEADVVSINRHHSTLRGRKYEELITSLRWCVENSRIDFDKIELRSRIMALHVIYNPPAGEVSRGASLLI